MISIERLPTYNLKKNFKFRGGLLVIQRLLSVVGVTAAQAQAQVNNAQLKLILLSTAISKDVNAASWIKAFTTAIVLLFIVTAAWYRLLPLVIFHPNAELVLLIMDGTTGYSLLLLVLKMEEYIQFETERALRNGKVYNWETAKYVKELCSDDDKESLPNWTFTTNVIVMIHSAKDRMDNQGKSEELEHWDKDFKWFNGDTPIRKEFDEFCERWWGKNGKNKEPGCVSSSTLVMFLALGWHLEEIHMTLAHLEKEQTRLRLYTKNYEVVDPFNVASYDGFPHHGIDLWLQVQIFYDRVNDTLKETIDYAAEGRLRKLSAENAWATIEKLAQYENEGWNNPVILEEEDIDYENPNIEHLLGVMEYKVDTLMKDAFSLMGRSKGVFRITGNETYQLPQNHHVKENLSILAGKSTKGKYSRSQEPLMEDKIQEFVVFDRDVHQMNFFVISRHPIHPRNVIDWDFPATHGLAREYNSAYPGVSFRLRGETKTMSLMELGWRVILYSEEESRIARSFGLLTNAMRDALHVEPKAHVFNKRSLIAMNFVMDLGRGTSCWPATREVGEDDEVKEVTNVEAGGSAKVYQNISWGDWQGYLMRLLELGWHLEEIHVTWEHLGKERMRLRLYTKNYEEKRTVHGDGVSIRKRRRLNLQWTASERGRLKKP
ncbi:hypothetical protein Tco_0226843 [Tanacetum coccineum]